MTIKPKWTTTLIPDLYTGQRLTNGATVVTAERTDRHLSVALCIFGKAKAPYVTWFYNHQTGGAGNGHYFNDLAEAMEDFKKRVDARRSL